MLNILPLTAIDKAKEKKVAIMPRFNKTIF